MLKVGDKAPDFTLKDQDQNEISLKQFKGKNVLLAFYPFDLSPVCTDEFSCVQKDLEKFNDKNTQVLGISIDSHWSHKAFHDKLKLNFPLLSDFSKKVCKNYGTLRKEGFSERAYFLIDKEGIINFMKFMPNPGVRMENEELIKEIKAIK